MGEFASRGLLRRVACCKLAIFRAISAEESLWQLPVPPKCVSASSRPLWQGKYQAAPARTICGPSTKSGQVKEESGEVAGTSPAVFSCCCFLLSTVGSTPPRRIAHHQ